MPEATERIAAHEPRHRRRDAGPDTGVDPFALPDPVAEKLRRWRAERDEPVVEHNGRSPAPDDPLTDEDESRRTVVQPEYDSERSPGEASSYAGGPQVGSLSRQPGPPVSLPDRHEGPGHREPASEREVHDHFAPPASVHPPRSSFGSEVTPIPGGQSLPVPGDEAVPFSRYDTAPVRTGTASESAALAAPAIEVRNLHKRFKDTIAVDDVSFTVRPGSIVAILGPNGAGKTTTINMLCTLLKPDRGSAVVHGHDVVSDAPAVRRSIMLTGQFAALDESLTGRENLILFGRLLGLSKADARKRADELLDTFSLLDAGSKKVGKYSGGMRRRIDIACGLVTAPKVVFLDEPTTGLDPRSRQEVWSLVEKLRESGVTILLTTQYLEEADTLADNIVVIDKGRVVAEGTADELKDSIGAAYCEVTPAHATDVPRLRELLADLIPQGAVADDHDHVVAVPAPRGPETLVEVIQRIAAVGIPLSDVALRRPSLDEVFLALTDPRRDRRPKT